MDELIETADGQMLSQEQVDELAAKREEMAKKALLQGLANQVQQEFDESKRARIEIERRWVDDLRQYKGVYDEETLKRLEDPKHKRSKLFLRLTRAKVKSTNARMADMLFPAGDKNWSINPTPIPTVDPEAYRAEIEMILAEQGQIDEEALKAAINEVAKQRCEAMAKTIDDQLEEGGYEGECRKVIASGNMFGTGILKGPMATPRYSKRWKKQGGQWGTAMQPEQKPYFNFVPVWNYYPDPKATERRDCAFEIEWHPMNKGEFQGLLEHPSFDQEAIREVLRRYPTGTSNILEQWESDLRLVNKNESNKPLPTGRFVVLERWGSVSGQALALMGVDGLDELLDYEAQVWVCGGQVIRAQINPYDTASRPFKIYYFDKDETSIWGEGIPSIMRDTQKGANTALRATVDNAAAGAIPMFEVNMDLMHEANEDDPDAIYAGRVFKRKGRGVDSQYPAVRAVEIPTRVEQFTNLIKLFIEFGDEVTTLPRYTYGSNDGSSVSKTVGGLSMLMGQANISLKESVKAWDDGITTPFIGDTYAWNMQFHSDESIKGDFDVIARGSSSLVAKEVRANALAEFTMDILKGAPEFAKKRELYAERARNLDLDPDIFLLTQEEADKNNMALAAQEALVRLAEGLGLNPQALMQNMDQFIDVAKQAMDTQAAVNAQPTQPQGAANAAN